MPAPGAHGYLMPGYNYDSLIAVHPVATSTPGETGSSSVPGWLWLVVIGGIAVITIGCVRRGRRRELDVA